MVAVVITQNVVIKHAMTEALHHLEVEDPEMCDQSPVKRCSDPTAGPLLNTYHEPHLGSTPWRVD